MRSYAVESMWRLSGRRHDNRAAVPDHEAIGLS